MNISNVILFVLLAAAFAYAGFKVKWIFLIVAAIFLYAAINSIFT